MTRDPEKQREYSRRWREKNREKLQEIQRRSSIARYKENPEKKRERSRAWREKNKEKMFEYRRHQKYGVSPEKQRQMLDDQDHLCAICKKREKLQLDHCHKTKKVRAFLCRGCNLGIGHLGDDVQVLIEAARYLLQHQKKG